MDIHHVYSGEVAAVHQIGGSLYQIEVWSEQISTDSV